MKRQPYKNLRYSQKVREAECFIEADGLQKKIRKFNAGKIGGSVDAEMKMREIECFWKEGWDYNHTHHIYLQPKVTRPQFYIPKLQQNDPKLDRYYDMLHRFINRLKIDNEDETNFKIDLRNECEFAQLKSEMELQGMSEQDDNIKDRGIVSLSFEHLVGVFAETAEEMIANFNSSLQIARNDMLDSDLDEGLVDHLPPVSQICNRCRNSQSEQNRLKAEQFMQLLMHIINQSKDSKQYSAVVATQSEMGELSNILHPLCWGLYATFCKETLVKEANRKRGRRYADEQDDPLALSSTFLREQLAGRELLSIKDDFRQSEQRHSRVVFLNLDGLESQFTLEFMRNFADNVMYVSFPKFEAGNNHYNKRFHKKIMYNFTRSELDILGCCEQEGLDAMGLTIQRQELINNPQKYHQTVDQFYTLQKQGSKPNDFNRSIFVFPIGLETLQAEQQISSRDRCIDGYQSNFIRFILRDQLYTAMRSFKPQTVLISYSGRLRIQNDHFLQIMQQLLKICPKTLLFPNFTPALTRSSILPPNHIGKGIVINQQENELTERVRKHYENLSYNPWQLQLMEKLSIFLKVSAGYYTLLRPFQEEDLSSKYKNSRVFRYIIYLYSALKNEYEHSKRRVESSTLETARASLQANINEHSKEISRCIPPFYVRLFGFITSLLQDSLQNNPYSLLAEEVRDRFPSTFEQDQPYLQGWAEVQKEEQLVLAGAKYHEISQIQVRQRSSRQEYMSLKDQKMNNIDSFYRVSFYYKQDSNQIVKLYSDVTLLWKENQAQSNKNHFYLVLSNLFTPKQHEIHHYIAKPKLSNKKLQRCQIVPISFHSKEGPIPRDNMFKVWTQWNYAETARHVILYWPSEFDFVSYYLSKLLKRNYQPTLLPRLFATLKSNQSFGKGDCPFYQINIGDRVDVAPRSACSTLNFHDQIYIFGGSYHSQQSYLNLQNDVTTLDLTDNNLLEFYPAKLINLNKELYCNEAFWGKLREGRQVNSFVRARQQFQFYDRDELLIDEAQGMDKEDDIRIIYMIGGYGQQFKTPYSLFVNHFYEIAVQKSTRRLISIKKKVVPEKVVPINVRAMIKNRGIYQKANILELSEAGEDEQKVKEGMTNNRHYFHHQVVYAIKNQQLNYKIKNLFAMQLYQNSKKDYYNFGRRMGQIRNTEQAETTLVRKIEGSHHQVLVEIGDIYYLYSLNLELRGEEVDQIPLMNESIIALDTKKLIIFALISHSKHTQSKSILASQAVRLPSQSIIDKEKHYALVLKEVMTFEQSLNLHTLIICNANEVVLLHGVSFQNCKNKQYLIKLKSKNDIKKEELAMVSVNPLQFSNITSFFAKKNNIINSINFLKYAQSPQYLAIHRFTLDINRFAEGWRTNGQIDKICFIHGNNILQKTTLQARIDSSGDVNSIILLIYSSKKTYHIKLCQISDENSQIRVQQLNERTIIERYKCMQCLVRTVKSEQLYADFEYFI